MPASGGRTRRTSPGSSVAALEAMRSNARAPGSQSYTPKRWLVRLADRAMASDQRPGARATRDSGASVRAPAAVRASMPGTGRASAAAGPPATRMTQQRRPPLAKKLRTAGPSCADATAPACASHVSGASSPKIIANCSTSSRGTGTCTGPLAAMPTNTATSMRGRTSSSAGVRDSNAKPGRRRSVATAIGGDSIHLEALVREDELLHRHVAALGVERPAGVLDDPCADQLPGHDDRRVILV